MTIKFLPSALEICCCRAGEAGHDQGAGVGRIFKKKQENTGAGTAAAAGACKSAVAKNQRHCFRIVIYNENTNRNVRRRKRPLTSLREKTWMPASSAGMTIQLDLNSLWRFAAGCAGKPATPGGRHRQNF
jgi:hypothetical protein